MARYIDLSDKAKDAYQLWAVRKTDFARWAKELDAEEARVRAEYAGRRLDRFLAQIAEDRRQFAIKQAWAKDGHL